jgi:hypothetical protein
MKEDARLKRNAQRQTELFPAFRRRLEKVIRALEASGFRPRIQDGWRSPQEQVELFEKGTTKVKFGFHNITDKEGGPASLAVDLLDDDFALNPRKEYLLRLAGAAQNEGLTTGIDWGLPPVMREAIRSAIASKQWNAKVKIGWDPTHVEPTGLTIAEARAGKRPT